MNTHKIYHNLAGRALLIMSEIGRPDWYDRESRLFRAAEHFQEGDNLPQAERALRICYRDCRGTSGKADLLVAKLMGLGFSEADARAGQQYLRVARVA